MAIHYPLEMWGKTFNPSHKIGNEKISIIEYDKVVSTLIPLNEKITFDQCESDVDHFKMASKTQKLLKKFK